MASKPKNLLAQEVVHFEDPHATPSKRQRRNALSGDSIVNAADFFSGTWAPTQPSNLAPTAFAVPGTPGTASRTGGHDAESAYQMHFQSVQVFMPLDDDVEKRAWDILLRTVNGTGDFANGELKDKRPAAICVAMVWLAARLIHLEAPTGSPRHPLFEILSTVCAMNSNSKPYELVCATLTTFEEVIPLAFRHAGIEGIPRQEVEKLANNVITSYRVYADAFRVCADAFDLLTVHSQAAPRMLPKLAAVAAMDDTGNGLDNYGQELFSFAWLLTLNSKEHLIPGNTEPELLRMISLYCLTFVVTQASTASRRPIADVVQRASGQRLTPAHLNGVGSPGDDWISHAQTAKGAICHLYGIDPARYEALESQFIQTFLMPHLIETPQFKYRSVVVLHESFAWPRYEGAMDADRHSYFHVNLEHLRNRHAAALHGKNDEVDGRVFLQVQKPNATPRRYVRTQNRATMNSVRSSPGVKGLGQMLTKVRSANSNLMSTSVARPTSAPNSPGPSGEGDLSGLQHRLEELLAPESFDPARSFAKFLEKCTPELAQTILAQLVERERAVADLIASRDPSLEGFCSMSIRLYHRVLHNFLKTFEGKKRTTTMADLLLDGQFHRALLVCCFECIRFTFKVNILSFSDIFQLFSPRYLELYMMLDLVCERESWLSWMLTKRLRQIEARILEVEIWKDPLFHDLLIATRSGNDVDSEEASKTALHYGEVLREMDDATNRNMNDPISYLVEVIMKKASLAGHQRLKEIGLHVNMTEVILDRTWAVMEHLLANEDQYQLISGRNLDVVILCTIFAVSRVSDVYLTFNEIRTIYQSMPSQTPEALAEVPISQDRTGDIVTFYNELYLPLAKGYIAEEIGTKRTGKTPMLHRRKHGISSPMRQALRTPAHRLQSSMTPVTKKLYSFGGESPRRATQGVPFPAGLQQHKPPLSSNNLLNLPMPASSRRRLM